MHPTSQQSLLWHNSILYLTYILHFAIVTSPVAALIGYVEMRLNPDVTTSPAMANLMRHHKWLRNTFVVSAVFAMIALGTAYMGVGIAVAAALAVWWIYRIIRGVVSLAWHKPLPLWS